MSIFVPSEQIEEGLPGSYRMVILGPAPAPDDVQSCSLAANRTAMALYTIATSLEGEAATIGLPASDVSRIAMFRGTCRQAIEKHVQMTLKSLR